MTTLSGAKLLSLKDKILAQEAADAAKRAEEAKTKAKAKAKVGVKNRKIK